MERSVHTWGAMAATAPARAAPERVPPRAAGGAGRGSTSVTACDVPLASRSAATSCSCTPTTYSVYTTLSIAEESNVQPDVSSLRSTVSNIVDGNEFPTSSLCHIHSQ